MPLNHQHAPATIIDRAVKAPSLYNVILLNDDFTPQDFVVDLLRGIFAMTLAQAMTVMLHVHHRGSGVCGVYTREIAELKVAQVQALTRQNEYPLRCVVQET